MSGMWSLVKIALTLACSISIALLSLLEAALFSDFMTRRAWLSGSITSHGSVQDFCWSSLGLRDTAPLASESVAPADPSADGFRQ